METSISCFICDRIELASRGNNPYLIKEFKNSIFVVGDHQLYQGMAFLLFKHHKCELTQIENPVFQEFMSELHISLQAIERTFAPQKINTCSYGNGDAHVHWHIIPRFKSDSDWGELPYFKRDHPRNHLISHNEARKISMSILKNI